MFCQTQWFSFEPELCWLRITFRRECRHGQQLRADMSRPHRRPSRLRRRLLSTRSSRNVLRDQKAIWTARLHLHKSDARWLAPLTVETASGSL
jgi:hypothetical protein